MADLEALLANATVVRIEPGDHLFVGRLGRVDSAEMAREILDALGPFKERLGIDRIWLFEEDIDVKAMPAETLAEQLLDMAERDPEVGKALEELFGRRNRVNGQEVL